MPQPGAGEAGLPPGAKGTGTVRAARCLGLALLVLPRPAEPWYVQTARPRHCSVGRISGLLSDLCRSPAAPTLTALPNPISPCCCPAPHRGEFRGRRGGLGYSLQEAGHGSCSHRRLPLR